MPLVTKIVAGLLLVCAFCLTGRSQSAPSSSPQSQQGSASQSAPAATPQSPAQSMPGAAPQPVPGVTPGANPLVPGAQTQPAAPVDLCAPLAGQPGFDECYYEEFKTLDQDVNHMYRAALLFFEKEIDDAHKRSDNDQLSYDATAIGDLKAAQTAWTKYRDLHCSAAGQQLQGGLLEPSAVTRCMIQLTQHRIEEMQQAYEIGGRKLE
jgi:uncharacterized protein YecT (DUF1311 family)